ncbi:hypothetical protein LJU02_08965 [Corynebacterium pseudotuberculosis]|uniref:Histone n=2 Tax=Corynebacterium pseudotuberculosis TaxID=1719 RepID=D9QCC4_CORP2|nr:hypothetical protein [Corynebacterium pseudotuberculosis]AER69760.1 Hypothetical protein Cp106_1709 [Corynebacterium pseudotuberculosis 1/06-A]ADK29544.1 hypothetical protein CPFRC_08875 [Corynebacterium pseudotuberculosis FRC41]ADL11200.1 hypothetical protein CPC231_08875 [Corynebacterium pseudotuberculosis C231]ADL21616.1 hypothetical protein CP1002_04270 [Corynebacterium pseudotuberculosis 1002]AEK93074.1 Hypothetical protein CpPAT10_1752 [Corynebacterium pseudotuberculosis PAT10]
MPPKVTDTRTNSAESLHAVEAETAAAARRIIAGYAKDFFDGVTLMCMLGVEPEGLSYRKVAAEYEEANAPKKTRAKKTTKKAAKKTTKKTTKKAAKKTTKKATKKATKKTTKKTTKKA